METNGKIISYADETVIMYEGKLKKIWQRIINKKLLQDSLYSFLMLQ